VRKFRPPYLCKLRPPPTTKSRQGLAITVIHQTRKARSEDPIEDISGTFGLPAACDSWFVMRHHEDGAVLYAGGRLWDREQTKFELRREPKHRWGLVGEFSGLSVAQRATLDVLRSSGGMGPSDAAKFWNITKQSAQERLQSLLNAEVAYSKAGVYYAK
jgi:hypothetical protein